MPKTNRHPLDHDHRRGAHRHRPGLRVRLLRRAGLQGAARGGLPGHPGQLQPGHDHDRPGDGRRHLHRADYARRSSPGSSRPSARTRSCPPWAARPASTPRSRLTTWACWRSSASSSSAPSARPSRRPRTASSSARRWTASASKTPRPPSPRPSSRGDGRHRACRPARHHPPGLHPRRHRRRRRLQPRGLRAHLQDRPRRLAGLPDPDRRERCSAGRSSRWRWSATRRDNCIIVCSIENIDPMGVHTGDSITVAPALTLTDKEYQMMRNASIAVLREIGVETGGSNVQFAVHPETGRLVVIEMNPRVSRSSALASKATGFPDRQDRRQARRGLHPRRARQRHHPGHPRLVRADHRLRRHQDPALRLREVPRRRTAADHRDEIGRRGDGHRADLPRERAEGALLARDRPHRLRRDRDRRRRRPRRARRHRQGALRPDPGPPACRRPGHAPRPFRRRRSTPSPTTTPGSSPVSARSSTRRRVLLRDGLPRSRTRSAASSSSASPTRALPPSPPARSHRSAPSASGSACARSSSASTPAPASSRPRPRTCTRPTRPSMAATPNARHAPPTGGRWSSSAAARTASARASSSTTAAATPASR